MGSDLPGSCLPTPNSKKPHYQIESFATFRFLSQRVPAWGGGSWFLSVSSSVPLRSRERQLWKIPTVESPREWLKVQLLIGLSRWLEFDLACYLLGVRWRLRSSVAILCPGVRDERCITPAVFQRRKLLAVVGASLFVLIRISLLSILSHSYCNTVERL